jgi:hypothetical protein
MTKLLVSCGLVAALATLSSCLVTEYCTSTDDCTAPQICSRTTGRCEFECRVDGECPSGFVCEGHRCIQSSAPNDGGADAAPIDATADVGTGGAPSDAGQGSCPSDMVKVALSCVDRYEAARNDATDSTQGAGAIAVSKKGVLPWFSVGLAEARAACAAAGKRLCRLDEWIRACSGPTGTVYAYGNAYEPTTCNGIDAFGGSYWKAVPTGSFPACVSAEGLYDVNGNVWELADTNDGLEHFRGGAYNCSDSAALHRCDHDGTWGPSARGFRCCKDPE